MIFSSNVLYIRTGAAKKKKKKKEKIKDDVIPQKYTSR